MNDTAPKHHKAELRRLAAEVDAMRGTRGIFPILRARRRLKQISRRLDEIDVDQ